MFCLFVVVVVVMVGVFCCCCFCFLFFGGVVKLFCVYACVVVGNALL